MIKLKRLLVPENGMDFDDVCSARTANYIILWNHMTDCFVIIDEMASQFECGSLPHCRTFDELDAEVYKVCGEHIEAVSDKSKYKLTLIETEV